MSSHSASGSRSRSHSQSSHDSHGSDSSDSVALPSNPPAPAVEPVTEAGQTATTTPAAAEGAPQRAVEAGPPSEGKTSLYIGFGQDKNTRDISARALQEYMQNILYQLNGKTEDDEAQDALYAAEQAAAAAAAAATAEAEGEEKKESEEKPAEGAQEKPAEAAAEVAAEGEKKEGEGQGGNEEEGSKAEGARPRRERRPRRFPPVQKRTNGVLHVRMSFRCAFAEIATRKEALQLVEALNGKPYGEEYTLTVELSQPKPKPERKERKERKERGSSRRERDGGASSRRGGRRDSPARRDRRSPPRRDRNAIVMFIGLGPRARDIRDAELRDSLNRFVPIRALRRSGTCAFAEVENYRDGDYLIDRANGMRLGEVRVAVQYSRESIRPPGGVVERRRGRSRSHSRGRRSRSRSPSDSRRRVRDDSRDRRRRRRSYTPSRSRSYSRSRSRTPERRRR